METNNKLIDDMMFSDNKSIYYLGHILRGNIYDKDDHGIYNVQIYSAAPENILIKTY